MSPKNEFEVERIVSDKFLVGKRFFFVKWKGFPSSENTWEPEENLASCTRIVREYFGGKGLRNTKSSNVSTTLLRGIYGNHRQILHSRRRSRTSSVMALASPRASSTPRPSVDLKPFKIELVNSKVLKFDVSETQHPSLVPPPPPPPLPQSGDVPACSDAAAAAAIDTATAAATSVPPGGRSTRSHSSRVNSVLSISLTRATLAKLPSMLKTDAESEVDLTQEPLLESKVSRCRASSRSLTAEYSARSSAAEDNVGAGSALEAQEADNGDGDDEDVDDDWVDVADISTSVDEKPRRGLTVRLFDSTPRPGIVSVLTPRQGVAADSDEELASARVTEEEGEDDDDKDSNKENKVRFGGRRDRRKKRASGKRKSRRGVKNAWSMDESGEEVAKRWRPSNVDTSADRSQASSSRAPPKYQRPNDNPLLDHAVVLFVEPDEQKGPIFVIFFPRLNLVKRVPQNVADKFYSEAMISYYRRQTQEPVAAKAARRRSL